MIEGHVPTTDVRRLLAERPDAFGLAVPGMPYGSPGMGPENERQAYDVFLIHKDDCTEIFSSYEAAWWCPKVSELSCVAWRVERDLSSFWPILALSARTQRKTNEGLGVIDLRPVEAR